MGSATNKPDQHRQYEGRYPALDNADGLRILLGDLHALRNRRFQGDTAASDILIDLARAIGAAGLTDRQRTALALVYDEDLTQKDAGQRLGIAQNTLSEAVDRALEAVAEVYFYWCGHGEGYCLAASDAKGEAE